MVGKGPEVRPNLENIMGAGYRNGSLGAKGIYQMPRTGCLVMGAKEIEARCERGKKRSEV